MSSTTGRRYLRLLCGGTWGLSGEEGSGVLTQASRFPWACGWPWGRAGGLSERIPPSLPRMSLRFTVVQRAFLGLPWVSPVCGAVAPRQGGRSWDEASDGRDSVRPGCSALQWRATSCWFPRNAHDQEPSWAVRVLLSPALAACGEGGVGIRPVGSFSTPAQEPLRSHRAVRPPPGSPAPSPLPPRDCPAGLGPLVRCIVVRVSSALDPPPSGV